MGFIEREVEHVELVEPLDRQGEALLKANIADGERILVKLQTLSDRGDGEAFVVTDRRIYILKYGWITGHAFGGQCGAYGFNQITGLEIRKRWKAGVLEILTPADRNTQGKNPIQADNMLMFVWDIQGEAFQRGVNIARETMQKALNASTAPAVGQQSAADEIEKLALLRDKGILTEDEYQAKKRQLLGL